MIDADKLARAAVLPGTPALEAIATRWGATVLNPDGTLNRAALRQLVFANAADRTALDAIVHPHIERLRAAEVALLAARDPDAIVVCDIPLLFEKNLQGAMQMVVLVDAPPAMRFERLTTLRGLSPHDAQAMMDSQLPSEQKRPRADVVIDNVGSPHDLAREVDSAWTTIRERAARVNAIS